MNYNVTNALIKNYLYNHWSLVNANRKKTPEVRSQKTKLLKTDMGRYVNEKNNSQHINAMTTPRKQAVLYNDTASTERSWLAFLSPQSEQQLSQDVLDILQDEKLFVNPEAGRPWTDEEYREATIKLYCSNGERAWEVDREAYIEETRRLTATAERTNQFYFVLRDFSAGIINDGFGPRIYSGYDSDIFYKIAATFADERKAILMNFGGYLTDEEVDNRLKHLHEQFDDAFTELANIINGYADDLNRADRQNVIADVKAYGEMIKSYVCSGNSVPIGGTSSALYSSLSNNIKTTFSLYEINKIGLAWHSKYMTPSQF